MDAHKTTGGPQEVDSTELVARLSSDLFDRWYADRKFKKNLERGTPFFNGPPRVPEANRHNPSSLLQCHRKVFYRQLNAPSERRSPRGTFWFGSKLEVEILFRFLSSTAQETGLYVANDLRVDYEIQTGEETLHIKGSTDPVFVDPEGDPLLVTEIKTKSDRAMKRLEAPDQTHLAQIHAYMYGLSEHYEQDISDGAIIYVDRTSLLVKSFQVEFDPQFWDDLVVAWAREHTRFRTAGQLPPEEPHFEWECSYCEYRLRCGQGNDNCSDAGVVGFVEGVEYPRDSVEKHIEAWPEAELTPTIAAAYPDISNRASTTSWSCECCSSEFAHESVEAEVEYVSPLCPRCLDRGVPAELHPLPITEGYGSENRLEGVSRA
ncbi:Dna2/Cas4 domain-containing protein [Haloferax sp. Atlit-12N]|uniref:CRISPR-associated protein Cas4 n=1 Tax=Haloferax sp. Atlit-12N TaxID=2077203 RepID=UPI000E2384D5|nr:PD-(D/E)XK nuclease family protein [Haloferax sp. Atlit-12N]RDZ64213.1 Dna2/Cas4 domain-containing protein [Haloferax sp. Atlit-12N]